MSHKEASVTGAWLEHHAPGDRRFLKIGDVGLESGETLQDVTIAYQSWGKLNENKELMFDALNCGCT